MYVYMCVCDMWCVDCVCCMHVVYMYGYLYSVFGFKPNFVNNNNTNTNNNNNSS